MGYSGSHTYDMVGNENAIGNVSYGVNINVFPEDLIIHESHRPDRTQSELRFHPLRRKQSLWQLQRRVFRPEGDE